MGKMVATALALALAAPAAAVNINVFKDAPITRLTADELKVFRAIVMTQLSDARDGATYEWRAPATRFSSKITVQKSFADGTLRCREARIESDAHDLYQRGVYTFCRAGKGEWQLKLPPGQSR